MTTDDSTPTISDDESYRNGVRYETWTDRTTGRAYVRADFSDRDADSPTFADRPDTSPRTDTDVPLSKFSDDGAGSLFGASGIEVVTLDYPYYTGAEKVAPYERHFMPDWALAAFERHGYGVLAPDEMPDDDGEIITDGGEDFAYQLEIIITAELPGIGERDYTFSLQVSDQDDADDEIEDAKAVIPDDGNIIAVDSTMEEL